MNRTASVLRAAGALTGVLGLLVGLPALILVLTEQLHVDPLPWPALDTSSTAPPLVEQLKAWAQSVYQALRLEGLRDLVQLGVLALLGAVWLGVLGLVLNALLLAARDGAGALRLRAAQWGPRGWIAGLLALVLSGLASPAQATPRELPVAAAPHHPGQPLARHTPPTRAATEQDLPQRTPSLHLPPELRPDCPRYRVHAGESLTTIAARHLGDGRRWRELAALNGTALSAHPDQLQPGWILLLPPDADEPQQPPAQNITVAPGDTLSNLAAHHLGDPRRWTEIWDLNAGRIQHDGLRLAMPGHLRPGWELVVSDEPHRPASSSTPAAPAPSQAPVNPWPEPLPPGHERPAPSPAPPVSPLRAGTTPTSHRTPAPNLVTSRPGGVITLTSGGFVAAALSGSVAVAMLIRRRRRLRAYLPHSGDRAPLPAPGPAVRTLRGAYERSDVDDNDDAQAHELDEDPVEERADDTAIEIGSSDGRVHALDFAATSGLAITGPGASAAVRSLLVHLLGTTHAAVVIPTDDAHALLGPDLPDSTRLHIVEDLLQALATVDTGAASRGLRSEDETLHTVLVASIEPSQSRLQSLLRSGSDRGLAAILLGEGPHGTTLGVSAQGIVETTSPALDQLSGTRLFSLDAADTRDLVALFTETALTPAPPLPAEGPHDPAFDHDPAQPKQDWPGSADAAPSQSQPQTDVLIEPVESPENGFLSAQPPGKDNGTRLTREESTSPEQPGISDDDQCHRWSLTVLGPIVLMWHGHRGQAGQDMTSVLSPKHKTLLVFLALHPSGTTREAVREALWPEAGGRRPFNAFYASLSQMRKALTAATGEQAVELISQHDEYVALNPHAVTVDYWDLHAAERDMHSASTEETRMAAWSRIATLYRGELADGMSALWLDGPREAAHRCVVDALAGMAAHYRGRDPHRQWQLLEHARVLNPENEAIYRDIMRVQAELGLTDGISRTVNLLTTTLADIDERPNPSTLTLARALQARHEDHLGPSRNSEDPDPDST